MRIILNGKTLEPPLKRRELPIFGGPEDQMPVIGHQTIGKNADGNALVRFDQNTPEGVVILRLVKEGMPGDGSVEDMIDQTARSIPRSAGHGCDDSSAVARRQ